MALNEQVTLGGFALSIQQQEEVHQKTLEWFAKAAEIFNVKVAKIDTLFDLKGRTSGMFFIRGNRQWIRYNPWIFSKHFNDSIATTVPHEVAHYICFLIHGRRHKSHGKEWKSVMAAFGAPANATCKLDISDIPQKNSNALAINVLATPMN